VRQRNEVYFDEAGSEYRQPPEVGRVPGPSRRTTVEDYEDSVTDSDSLPVRYPVQESQTHFAHRAPSHASFREPTEFEQRVPSHGSFREPTEFEQRAPSHGSFVQESIHQPSMIQPPSVDPQFGPPPGEHFVAPPGEVYLEEPQTPLGHENRPEYAQEPPVIQAEPRRYRARRGEPPITVGNMRIEVEDDGRHSRSHRGRRSRSRSTGTYSSRTSSGSYTSSSVEEQPIIISADPHTEIEIGNERDGFVPYEQYLASRESRRRARRHHHRRTPEEEVYVIPPGANVIFVDEDGHELHRVGEIDERYSGRRRSSRARTTRQVDGSVLIEM